MVIPSHALAVVIRATGNPPQSGQAIIVKIDVDGVSYIDRKPFPARALQPLRQSGGLSCGPF